MQAVRGAALSANEPLATGTPDVVGDEARDEVRAHPRTMVALISLAILVLGVDLVSKILAVRYLEHREPVRLLGGAIYLLLTRNSGAAFSIARDYTFVFAIVAIVVVGWIVWLALRMRSIPWAISLGLVLGGTLGNLADRLFRAPGPFLGHVVDFISVFDPQGQGFPVFNIADSALCCGVGLAILLELTGRRRDGTRLGAAVAADGQPEEKPNAGDVPD